jgi:hypothetical protein
VLGPKIFSGSLGRPSLKGRLKRVAVPVVSEVLAALIALLLVVVFAFFFYLFCLPWAGVN